MIYFLAWIIVGLCCASIVQTNVKKHVGEYGAAIWAHCHADGMVKADDDLIKTVASNIWKVHYLTMVVLAPYALYAAIMSYSKTRYSLVANTINEYVEKFGMPK